MTLRLVRELAASAALALGCAAPSGAAVLLHSYDFGAGVVDSVGAQNGTLLNGASIVGGALSLDGVDDYVQFASSIVPTNGSMSVAFWAREDGRSGGFVEFISQGATGGPGFYIGHTPAGNVRLTDLKPDSGVATGSVGNWVQYVMTVDAASPSTHLFMDGVDVWSTPSALQSGAGGSATRLGKQFAPYGEYFCGAMDDLSVYSGALTAGEVNALFQAGRSAAAGTVPEPSSIALVLGALALAGARRRRAA